MIIVIIQTHIYHYISISRSPHVALNKCHHLCQNYIGSYKCSCISGYKLDNDGFSCIDEDECKMFKTSSNIFEGRNYFSMIYSFKKIKQDLRHPGFSNFSVRSSIRFNSMMIKQSSSSFLFVYVSHTIMVYYDQT